jgi:hypothetical protein
LRERAVSDPRAAEILLRWLQRPRAEERVGGIDLDSMSEHELERLYAGLLKLAALPAEHLHPLLTSRVVTDTTGKVNSLLKFVAPVFDFDLENRPNTKLQASARRQQT